MKICVSRWKVCGRSLPCRTTDCCSCRCREPCGSRPPWTRPPPLATPRTAPPLCACSPLQKETKKCIKISKKNPIQQAKMFSLVFGAEGRENLLFFCYHPFFPKRHYMNNNCRIVCTSFHAIWKRAIGDLIYINDSMLKSF